MSLTNKDAILRIVRSCRTARRLSNIFADEVSSGINVFDHIAGDLEDALYIMNQEETETLEESVVNQLICNDALSDEDVADKLYELILSK